MPKTSRKTSRFKQWPVKQWPETAALGAIKGYKYFISPLLGNCCRFYPSCSSYAQEAIQTHGTLKGSWLAGKRILKCGPLHPGGYDPVPGKERSSGERCPKEHCQNE